MKILLLITGMSMGGAEKVVADLADALDSDGCEVLLVYMKGPLQVHPSRSGVRLVCLDIGSKTDYIPAYLRFRKVIRQFKPDIVHSHMFHAVMLARLARLTTRMQCMISTMHTARDGGRLRVVLYRLTDRLTDISTNVSHEAVDEYVASRAVRPGRMITIHNGIDVDKFQPSPAARARIRDSFAIDPDCKLFVAAGRLGWSKDYPNMFHALARLRDKVRFKLLIAGDGDLRQELEKLVETLGLASHVTFLGIRQDIADLMSAADVFALSSVGEGFGLVVAEAMACECVVVATDSGGVKEVLGGCGFLVPRSNSAALADALLAATSLPRQEAVAMGKAARQRVLDTYSFKRAMEKWRELYEGFLVLQGADQKAASQ